MNKYFILFFILFFIKSYSQYYIIGDSQCFFLEKNCIAKIYPNLAQKGIGIKELISKLNNIKTDDSVKAIFISIGVNDNYIDLGISELVNKLFLKFPNAFFFSIKGSYEWGNAKINDRFVDNYIKYYNKFADLGIYVLTKDIGAGDPHANKIEYKYIGRRIDNIITKIKYNNRN